MPAGVHVQPGFLLRTQLLPELKRAAELEGTSLTGWIVRHCRSGLAEAKAKHGPEKFSDLAEETSGD